MHRPTILVAAVAIGACHPLSGPGAPARLDGSWGGRHVGMVVSGGGATLDYDCASGSIDGPLLVDRRGRFAGVGTHSPGQGGPERIGEQPRRIPARYSGSVAGDRMMLRVDVDGGVVIGPYELRRGAEPILMRCL